MMTPKIVNAYRIILESADDLDQRSERMSSSFYGQHAEGLRTAAAVIEGICGDDPELSKQLMDIRNELRMESKDEKNGNI